MNLSLTWLKTLHAATEKLGDLFHRQAFIKLKGDNISQKIYVPKEIDKVEWAKMLRNKAGDPPHDLKTLGDLHVCLTIWHSHLLERHTRKKLWKL